VTKQSGVVAWVMAIIFLNGYEWWALATGHQSLSRAMVEMTMAWPPLIFFIGFVVGGLTAHFWWYWNPNTTTKGA
jgi:hypothetical protein